MKYIQNIKITEPILEKDFNEALKLIEENVLRGPISLEDLKSLALGDIFVAKLNDQVVGVITMRRPGEIFKESDEKFFSINKYEVSKELVGYIELITVDSKFARRGIATKLVKEGIITQRQFGAKAVGVFAWQGSANKASQKLFESLSFIPIALHHQPWHELSNNLGPEGYMCSICGNPCFCDALEMILYL